MLWMCPMPIFIHCASNTCFTFQVRKWVSWCQETEWKRDEWQELPVPLQHCPFPLCPHKKGGAQRHINGVSGYHSLECGKPSLPYKEMQVAPCYSQLSLFFTFAFFYINKGNSSGPLKNRQQSLDWPYLEPRQTTSQPTPTFSCDLAQVSLPPKKPFWFPVGLQPTPVMNWALLLHLHLLAWLMSVSPPDHELLEDSLHLSPLSLSSLSSNTEPGTSTSVMNESTGSGFTRPTHTVQAQSLSSAGHLAAGNSAQSPDAPCSGISPWFGLMSPGAGHP